MEFNDRFLDECLGQFPKEQRDELDEALNTRGGRAESDAPTRPPLLRAVEQGSASRRITQSRRKGGAQMTRVIPFVRDGQQAELVVTGPDADRVAMLPAKLQEFPRWHPVAAGVIEDAIDDVMEARRV